MSEMSNMMISEEAVDGQLGEAASSPKYPYGLRISLDEKAIQKMGMGDMPQVGKKMKMMAMVEVVEVRQYDRNDGDSDRGIDLQITDMAMMANDEERVRSAEEALYGNADDNSKIL